MDQLKAILSYAALGYEVSFTTVYGHEMVLMKKAYSHKAEKPLICEQIFKHEKAFDEKRFAELLDFMYEDIQEQEKTGIYTKRINE